MRGRSITLLVIPALLLGSCKDKEDKNDGPKTVKVETITVSPEGFGNGTVYSGTIQEGESVLLSFSAPGTIKSFNIQQGMAVAQGQIIGILDDSSLKSTYEITQATLAQAQDAYNRMKILHDANSLPDIKWVDVQQKLVQAQNSADIARNALDDATLRSPISGIVAEKYAEAGQVTAPGVPVTKIVQVNDVKAVISVPQNRISEFNVGDKAVVSLNDSDKKFEGTLVEKGVSANALSRSYDAKFLIHNAGKSLLPGMICNVTVEGKGMSDAIILPQSVVLLDERNNNFVWVDSLSTARKRIVRVNQLNDGGLEISSGLNTGDKVIVKGIQKVCNGTKLETVQK